MTIQIKEYHSVSAVHPPLGIQLRVFAAATVGHWNMSATTAAIGQFLLTATKPTARTSSAMAVSIWRAAAIGRTASRSVVSKNQNNSISESVCPSVARAYGRELYRCLDSLWSLDVTVFMTFECNIKRSPVEPGMTVEPGMMVEPG